MEKKYKRLNTKKIHNKKLPIEKQKLTGKNLERRHHQNIKENDKLEKYLELMSQWAYWQSAKCKLEQKNNNNKLLHLLNRKN